MKLSMRLFITLWLLGMTGILSLLWTDLPIPEAAKSQIPIWAIKLLSLIQPTVLLSVAVLLGVVLASKVGLAAPAIEALVAGQSVRAALRPQVIPGVVGGLIGGTLLIAIQIGGQLLLPPTFVVQAEALSSNTSFITRILYGGVTEELLVRWGLMTLFVWIGWRIWGRSQGKPSDICVIVAIALSAIFFGLGHLPLAFLLETPITAAIVAYIIIANSVFGLVAGYLYWRKGLECAIMAHMLVHVVLVVMAPLLI